MNLDLPSVMVITALVVNVSGVIFILETLLRRDEGAGRIWSLGFLGAMLTTLSYLAWVRFDDAWWAVAVGNAAFVAGTGCMWLGCRRFNGRAMRWPSLLVAAAVIAAATSVVAEGADGGDWAGALWMFVALLLFAGLGAAECLQGALGRSRTAWALSAVLALQSLFYVARTIAFVTVGPESAVFQAVFGTITVSFLTVILTIVAVVVTSLLRATRAPMRGYLRQPVPDGPTDGFVTREEFARALSALCVRAAARGEPVAAIAVCVDDLEQISTAFGTEVAAAVADTWRTGVSRHAPANAIVGEDGANGLILALSVGSAEEARRHANGVHRGLFDDLSGVGGGVIPVIGVGVAVSDASGPQPDDLVRDARDAATRAATSIESSVRVADAG